MKLKAAVVVLLVAILLAVTNPTQGAFQEYIARETAQKVSAPGTLTDGLESGFAWLMAGVAARRHDLVLFSIYRVPLGYGEEAVYLGILKNFIQLKGD